MNISVSQVQGKVLVTVFKLDGQMDGQNFQDLINKAQEAYNAGTRYVLLDLTDLTYISSAGLVALHSTALLLRGESLPNLEHGWSAYRSMGGVKNEGKPEERIKLFNPRPEITSVLDMVGFSHAFSIFNDFDEAIKSF